MSWRIADGQTLVFEDSSSDDEDRDTFLARRIDLDAYCVTRHRVFFRRWFLLSILGFVLIHQTVVEEAFTPNAADFDQFRSLHQFLVGIACLFNFILVSYIGVRSTYSFLRLLALSAAALATAAAALRVWHNWDDAEAPPVSDTTKAFLSSILAGMSKSAALIAVPVLSGNWFPGGERIFAMSICLGFFHAGPPIGALMSESYLPSQNVTFNNVSSFNVVIAGNNNSDDGDVIINNLVTKMMMMMNESQENGTRSLTTAAAEDLLLMSGEKERISPPPKLIVTAEQICTWTILHLVLGMFVLILLIIRFPSEPPLPPSSCSLTATTNKANKNQGRKEFCESWINILKNVKMWTFVISSALPYGTLLAFHSRFLFDLLNRRAPLFLILVLLESFSSSVFALALDKLKSLISLVFYIFAAQLICLPLLMWLALMSEGIVESTLTQICFAEAFAASLVMSTWPAALDTALNEENKRINPVVIMAFFGFACFLVNLVITLFGMMGLWTTWALPVTSLLSLAAVFIHLKLP